MDKQPSRGYSFAGCKVYYGNIENLTSRCFAQPRTNAESWNIGRVKYGGCDVFRNDACHDRGAPVYRTFAEGGGGLVT